MHKAHSGLSLRANFSWTLVGNIVYAGCQWGMIVVLARAGSAEMVGQFALGLAVTAPVIMFANLQLRGIQATDARREYVFGDYLGLRLITAALALLAIACITWASGYRSETAAVVLAIGVAKVFESVSDVFYGLFQQHEQMNWIARSQIIKGVASLVALGAGVALSGALLPGVLALALVWGALLLGYDIRNGARLLGLAREGGQGATVVGAGSGVLAPRWDRPTLRRLALLALPLGLVMLLISLNTSIPRYFIEQRLGEAELGVFAALSYLIVAGGIVVAALGQSASPRLARHYAAGEARRFRRLLMQLCAVGVLGGGAMLLAATVAGREILNLLYGPEYARVDLFIALAVAGGATYVASFLGYGMTAARHFRSQLPLFVGVTAGTALACAWLVPTYGLQGAAMALIVSAAVQIVGGLGIVGVALQRLEQRAEV
jgi:O-antigen/teichoic acid export membrane protein